MCVPIGVIIGIASAANSFIGQSQAARAQERAQARATKLEQARHIDQVNAARVQQGNSQVAKAQRIQAALRQLESSVSRARLSSMESGLSGTGLSVQALIDNMTGRFATSRFSETQREGMQDTSRDLAFNDLMIRSQQNLEQINAPITQPNLLGAILGGAQTALSFQTAADQWSGGGGDNSIAGAGSASAVGNAPSNWGSTAPPTARAMAPLPASNWNPPGWGTGEGTMLPGAENSATAERVRWSVTDWSTRLGTWPINSWD